MDYKVPLTGTQHGGYHRNVWVGVRSNFLANEERATRPVGKFDARRYSVVSGEERRGTVESAEGFNRSAFAVGWARISSRSCRGVVQRLQKGRMEKDGDLGEIRGEVKEWGAIWGAGGQNTSTEIFPRVIVRSSELGRTGIIKKPRCEGRLSAARLNCKQWLEAKGICSN